MRPLKGLPPGFLCGAVALHVALSSSACQTGDCQERGSEVRGVHVTWGGPPHLADGCLSGPSVVFPTVMLL